MIYEIAELHIQADSHQAFQAAVAEAVPLFKRATGCHAMRLDRTIERPDVYRLIIGWETLETHTVDFRSSADFLEWRRLVGPYFSAPPLVEHTTTVLNGF